MIKVDLQTEHINMCSQQLNSLLNIQLPCSDFHRIFIPWITTSKTL